MAARKKEIDNRQAILYSAVTLFLEKGFSGATAQAISDHAGMTTGGLFNYFDSKEAVLREIIEQMFKSQFAEAQNLIPTDDPVLLYGVETALQLHIAELNEALRDVYVTAYSLPTTSELIHKMTAKKLILLFGNNFVGYGEKDFYELEIGSAGLMRGYMARSCDMYFTIEQKIARFFEVAFRIYKVPDERQNDVAAIIAQHNLQAAAKNMIDKAISFYSGNSLK